MSAFDPSGAADDTILTSRGDRLAALAPQTLSQGDSVGRYILIDQLGAGGMGVVLSAFDPELDRKIALKLLRPGDDDPRGVEHARQRLVREAQAMAKLDHSNVITVHDVGTFRGGVFVAMELVRGGTLRDWMKKGRPWQEVLQTMVPAGRGLAAAHAAGLIHRDFKPDNVMVGEDGRVRVMDFGLVRAAGEDDSVESSPADPDERLLAVQDRVREALAGRGVLQDRRDGHDISGRNGVDVESAATLAADATGKPDRARTQASGKLDANLTRSGVMLGTPAYMPPEQFLGRPANEQSDQFSFCATLYEALWGQRAFEGETLQELMGQVTGGKLREPPSDSPVPQWLVRAVARGLAVDPSDRWPSMLELLHDIDRDPVRARKQLAFAGVTIGLASVSAVAVMFAYERRDEPCTGAEDKLVGVWDVTREMAVRDTFLATGLELAESTWQRVESGLNRYSDEWVKAYVDACEATHVHHEQSEDLLDRRMTCLDGRLRSLAAVADVLERPDRTVVTNAVESVARLPRLTRCSDSRALMAAIPPPDDPEVRTRVDALRDRLEKAVALAHSGNLADATRRLRQVALESADLGYRPFEAEALLQLGIALDGGGRAAESEEALAESAWLARAVGHDEVAAQAETWLVFVVGYRLGRPDDGLLWGSHARAEIERVGDTDGLLLGQLHNNRGVALQAKGRRDEALVHMKEALRARRTILDDEHPQVSESLYNVGLLMRGSGEYVEARQFLVESLESREHAFGPNHPKVAESLNGLGSVFFRQGEIERARAHYRRALEIRRVGLGNDHPQVATSLETLAAVAQTQGEHGAATDLYREALAILEQNLGWDHPRVGQTLHNLGTNYLVEQLYELTRDHYSRAYVIRERALGAVHPAVAQSLAALGAVELELGNRARAVEQLERSLQVFRKSPSEPANRAEAKFALARALWPDRRARTRALALATEARDLFTGAGAGFAKQLADVDAWLGERERGRR